MKTVFRYAAVASLPVYIVCAVIAHLHHPGSPLSNWLSDYGNPLINPGGAAWYNTGCIIVAVLLAVFFAGMYRWYAGGACARKYTISFIGAQASGILSSVFFVLVALYPLGSQTETHKLFSRWHMIGMDSFMVFIAIAYFLNPKGKKAMGVFGVLLSAFNIITTNAFTDLFAAQWLYIAGFMVFMIIVTLHDGKIHDTGGGKDTRMSAA